ncbi:uncharacterized protein [Dysidea avara]|uniref:uncharacterized protein n=1 Tax=Dysidea avara TaxID=196820 RepID=UPI003318F677
MAKLTIVFFLNLIVQIVLSNNNELPSEESLIDDFRPPSVPLMVVDPYFSVWSNADNLYDDWPRHWSGSIAAFSGMILIDGKPYRFMGKDVDLAGDAMKQTNLTVYPMQTIYEFQQDGIRLSVRFTTPSIPGDPFLGPYPITFITYEVAPTDGMEHKVEIYYDNTGEIAVHDVSEKIVWSREQPSSPGFVMMRIGTEAQDYFGQRSDRINWGYFYLVVEDDGSINTTMVHSTMARTAFMKGDKFPADDKNSPRPCSQDWPVLAVRWNLGVVGKNDIVSKRITLGYDQVYSIKYFGTAMQPYWASMNKTTHMLTYATILYDSFRANCDQLDAMYIKALNNKGGPYYATIASLAWRQTVGATIQVYNNVTGGDLWMFMKEISSDGDISTVDVIYPSSPLFLFDIGVSGLWSILEPILVYANNGSGQYGISIPYNLQWAPHHLGHWPVADLSPNHQEQMPVEESANMLIMIAAISNSWHGLVDFLEPYWAVLKIWADYIVTSLPDPGNQLCTDDFEGPSPHNVNLAAKGIVGLAAYANLLRNANRSDDAVHYETMNKQFVDYWLKNANDGDHYKLQYNLDKTWSLKYNLFFQKAFGIDLFPDSVFEMEGKYYMSKMNKYGVPLDNRADFTKTDWEMWVAAMEDDTVFDAITKAVYKFANETPDRVPFSDWYYTSTGKVRGFRARPVIGGLYAKMLVN